MARRRWTRPSQDNLADLAQLIAAGQFRDQKLVLAGFSDGSGAAEANLALSVERAAKVAQELAAVAPDLSPAQMPVVEGFGEALPMACDETAIGRQLNRRVELWVVPDFAPPGTPPLSPPRPRRRYSVSVCLVPTAQSRFSCRSNAAANRASCPRSP